MDYISSWALCPLFHLRDMRSLSGMVSTLPHETESFAKGDVILRQGFVTRSVFIVLSGSLSALWMGETIRSWRSGDAAAAALAVDGRRSLWEWVASEDGTVLAFITPDTLRMDPEISANLEKVLAADALETAEQSLILTRHGVREKLLCYLKVCASRAHGSAFPLLESQKDIAQQLGVTPVSVAREMEKLKKEGIVTITGRRCTLKNI